MPTSANLHRIAGTSTQVIGYRIANKAYFLYVTQSHAEKAKLLKMIVSNCGIDAVSLYPAYRKPFDLIFKRAKTEEWRAR
jgi:hypothetical protein